MFRWKPGFVLVAAAALVAASLFAPADAGIGDKLKKKVTGKADKATDDALNKAEEKATGEEATTPAAAPAAGEQKVSAVSTKFDYVPGDLVVLYDDFTQDELGEFPAAWKLVMGTWEIVEMDGERWLRSMSNDGHVRMKIPPALPEYWTLEFDFYCEQPTGTMLTVSGLNQGDEEIWAAIYPYGSGLYFRNGDITATTPVAEHETPVRRHAMFMARGAGLKVYIDRERVASVPEISMEYGVPVAIDFRLWSDYAPMITNVRFAEGNKPAADPFANGTFVTYGIYFDSGSDALKAESAPVLRQISAYMEKNPAVKVQIVGHTDSQGVPAENLDLSKRRAASVAKVLSTEFKIAADRFTTDGMGDTKPVSDNAKAEGRAMNRRVEFTKM